MHPKQLYPCNNSLFNWSKYIKCLPCFTHIRMYIANVKLSTIGVTPEHPFEFPESLGEVLQLVMKVDIFLYQCMNCILQFKAQTLQDQ